MYIKQTREFHKEKRKKTMQRVLVLLGKSIHAV